MCAQSSEHGVWTAIERNPGQFSLQEDNDKSQDSYIPSCRTYLYVYTNKIIFHMHLFGSFKHWENASIVTLICIGTLLQNFVLSSRNRSKYIRNNTISL